MNNKKQDREKPVFFKKFDGWRDYNRGRGKRRLLQAEFVLANGKKRSYNLAGLYRMSANPPPNFNQADHSVLNYAIKHRPV